jgi:hypothetical protein
LKWFWIRVVPQILKLNFFGTDSILGNIKDECVNSLYLGKKLFILKPQNMKAKFYALFVLISLFFTGCQITENIYLQEDGSGKISFDVDASAILEMMGDKMAQDGKPQVMDSTFTFKQVFEQKKDSISKLPKEEQARLKKMENMSVNMKMNAKEKVFMISMFTDFKKAEELQDMMQVMKSVKDLKKDKNESANPLSGITNGSDNSVLRYAFDGKTFKRSLKIIDTKLQEQKKDTTDASKMLSASSNYILKYHFPRKVKSVSIPNALFSEDRKTVTIQYSFMDYLDKPEKMSFEVVLE